MATSSFSIVVCLALAASTVLALPDSQWNAYKRQHGKTYSNPVEDALRREIFERNTAEIVRFNADESQSAGYTMGVNHMSDWTEEEFDGILGFRADKKRLAVDRAAEDQRFLDELLGGDEPIPDAVDWRNVTNRVTVVKNQGRCGSCWAFSTTGLLEGQEYAHAPGDGIPLSEQYLIDCSVQNHGCDGGNVGRALQDISANHGIADEYSYPYQGLHNQSCQFNVSKSIMTVAEPFQLPIADEEILKKTVARYGPVSVSVGVGPNWFSYKSGIFYDPNCINLDINHAVLVVGYGIERETKDEYWIIKNSWGKEWGMDGYIRLARNRHNHCFVASLAFIAKF